MIQSRELLVQDTSGQCLIGKSQKPEHLGIKRSGGHVLVEVISLNVNLTGRRDIAPKHVFDMCSRAGLVAKDMQGHAQNPLPDEPIGRLHSSVRKRGKSGSNL
jgi:aconitase A